MNKILSQVVIATCLLFVLSISVSSAAYTNLGSAASSTAFTAINQTGFTLNSLQNGDTLRFVKIYPILTQSAIDKGVTFENICSNFNFFKSTYSRPIQDIATEADVAYGLKTAQREESSGPDITCVIDFGAGTYIDTYIPTTPEDRSSAHYNGIYITPNQPNLTPQELPLRTVSATTTDNYINITYQRIRYQGQGEPVISVYNGYSIDSGLEGTSTKAVAFTACKINDRTPECVLPPDYQGFTLRSLDNKTDITSVSVYPILSQRALDSGITTENVCSLLSLFDGSYYTYQGYNANNRIETQVSPESGKCTFTFNSPQSFEQNNPYFNTRGIKISPESYQGLKETDISFQTVRGEDITPDRYVRFGKVGQCCGSLPLAISAQNSYDPILVDISTPTPPGFDNAIRIDINYIGCTTNCNSNIVFIPGLMGSRLYERKLDTVFCNEEGSSGYCVDKKWLPYTDSDIRDLYLKGDGTSVNPNIVTKDVVGSALGIKPLYKSLIDDMASWQQTGLVQNATSTPYDWRLSIDDVINKGTKVGNGYISYHDPVASGTTPYILDTILQSALSSRTGRVTIVAHSNGGLVAKVLMQKLRDMGQENIIDNLILIASPQIGTPDAGASLLHGSCIGQIRYINLCATSDPVETRGIAKNMPAAYHLLPSDEFFNTQFASDISPLAFYGSANTASSIQYSTEVKDAIKYRQYIKGTDSRSEPLFSDVDSPAIANAYLLNQATAMHDSLDAWRPASTTKVTEVAGFGVYTIAGLNYISVRECDKNFTGTCVPKFVSSVNDQLTINGDETVVSPSAHYLSSKDNGTDRWFLNLQGTQYTHKNILEAPELRTLIKSTITKATSTYSTLTNSQTPPVSNVEYYSVRVHSPLNIHLYDNLGNHTGLTASSTLETNIPGSQCFQNGTVKTIIAPKTNLAKVTLDAYANGSFTLDQEVMVGDTIIASSSIQAIPTATSTKVLINLNQTKLVESQIQVDLDGDNTIDISATPVQSQSIAYTPPVLVVSQTPVIQVSYGGSGGSLFTSPPALKTEAFPINISTTSKPIPTKSTSTRLILKKSQNKAVKNIIKKKVTKKTAVKKAIKKPIIKTKKKNI